MLHDKNDNVYNYNNENKRTLNSTKTVLHGSHQEFIVSAFSKIYMYNYNYRFEKEHSVQCS